MRKLVWLFVLLVVVVSVPAFAQECGMAPLYEPCIQDFPPDEGGGSGGYNACKHCIRPSYSSNLRSCYSGMALTWGTGTFTGSTECIAHSAEIGPSFCEMRGSLCSMNLPPDIIPASLRISAPTDPSVDARYDWMASELDRFLALRIGETAAATLAVRNAAAAPELDAVARYEVYRAAAEAHTGRKLRHGYIFTDGVIVPPKKPQRVGVSAAL